LASTPISDKGVKKVYHLATLKMVYLKEETVKERTINILMETETMDIGKRHLSQMQKAGMQRIKTENDVDPDMVKDAVILNISTMGYMTSEEFSRESV
jgi:hypothetical protein